MFAASKKSQFLKYHSIQILATSLFLSFAAVGQDSSSLTFSGYGELYYSFDFDNPATHEKSFFLYNHKRHNELTVNLAYAKVNYNTPKLRSNFALMVGTYPQYNLSAEPESFRFVYEANIGVKLSPNHNVWVDAGIMPSHIGFESAVSADCWTPSRSIVAENSPYYETGIKLTATNKKENFFCSILLLNGWQHIQRPAGINIPSVGIQLNYKPNDKVTLNYSNFLGTDKPDTLHAFRTYHNFYTIYQISNWGLITGLDIGTDKTQTNEYALWYSPVVIVRHNINKGSLIAFRSEYFNDSKQVLLTTNTMNGFKTFGLSLNYDYTITKTATVRAEWKGYFSKDNIFDENKKKNNHSLLLTMNLKL